MSLAHLVDESELETLTLGEGNDGFLSFSNGEHIAETGGETLACLVSNGGDFVGTGVVVDVLEHTDSTDIVSSVNDHVGAVLEFDDSIDFSGFKVELKMLLFVLNIILLSKITRRSYLP